MDVQYLLDYNLVLKSNLTYLIINIFQVILTYGLFSCMKELVWCQGFYWRTPLWIIASGSREKAYSNTKGDNMDFTGPKQWALCLSWLVWGRWEVLQKISWPPYENEGKKNGSEFIELDCENWLGDLPLSKLDGVKIQCIQSSLWE